MKRHIYDCAEGCPVESTLQIISGKWKSVIIYHLIKQKNCRFNELQKLMPNCSRRMLSLQLKELENDQIISKTVYPSVPPKTSYRLTNLGNSLTPLILEMEKWGVKYNLGHK
ncbi:MULTISPECIES: helix-turn-helix domain-containing protein [Lactobacillus]|jgi:DNA-binding HxlR family transcriptional regulator|uniref:Helix-turn-helix domain-containing protein n=1 Tax=Lactobacillus paragasseri TaxID=2107999 RepID=A0AAW6XNZ5_9LACO|nr:MULTISPECIES: helix-turn-helix domain-containing protein [Lactobacillus]MCQ5245864.1 helix-turn-helix transcriptional regulator [Lactobacillus gasseri]MCZ3507931.1 helix-turn-helix transcriptional regulator [Lactobacillus gasseri]MDK6867978.1 helix-turn-helix domain-containing protein [Lactobacillus paragasseri]OOK88434.1 transcriptional regulator [Lactobacillus gasseri]TVV00745.1 helix-turn-helix transcriptional regulator [Lactobacillus paragasseri]